MPSQTSSKRSKKVDSAVDQAARALRAFALSKEDGELLGSEDDLIERLGVSRPTLRQASSRVVQEHLISIRRGVGGGYFARTPGSMSVSRIAALYLRSRHASLSEITAALTPLRAELAMRAARNTDEEHRVRLRELMERDELPDDVTDHESYRGFLRSEREFGRLLGRMSNNTVLTLLLDMLYDFTANVRRDQDVLINRPERVRTYRKLRAKLARAILEGDVEIAQLSSQRCSDLVNEWIHKDFRGALFSDAEMRGS